MQGSGSQHHDFSGSSSVTWPVALLLRNPLRCYVTRGFCYVTRNRTLRALVAMCAPDPVPAPLHDERSPSALAFGSAAASQAVTAVTTAARPTKCWAGVRLAAAKNCRASAIWKKCWLIDAKKKPQKNLYWIYPSKRKKNYIEYIRQYMSIYARVYISVCIFASVYSLLYMSICLSLFICCICEYCWSLQYAILSIFLFL